jgi:ABC-type molybdate transport system substrate-binding protein
LLPTKNANAADFAFFMLSPEGQAILSHNGFDAPLLAPPSH